VTYMSKEKLLEDYTYLFQALKKHPSLYGNENKTELERIYERNRNQIYDYPSMLESMTELTMFFEDGHTNIELPYTPEDYCLKVPCAWKEHRLVLTEKIMNVEAGTEITAIEGVNIKEAFADMAKRIPHENLYLVKSRMTEYPYKNYHLFSRMNLVRLFGEKETYEITFESNDETKKIPLPLTRYDGFLDFKEDHFTYYELIKNKAILHVDGCVFDEQYKDTLAELAALCNERKIAELELDLSKNMGGTSEVISEFLKYVDVDSYHIYEMVDYSSGMPQTICRRADRVQNKKKDILFPSKISCRVSNTTFSSARTFAVTLKDNGIARIIGQPTGGKPCSYGMPRRDVTPNYKIRFRVSGRLFLRPNPVGDGEIALFPDVE